jgi:hypothetical protein
VNGISVDVWRILLGVALVVGLGLGALLMVAFRPAPADETEIIYEDGYQEGLRDGLARGVDELAHVPAVREEDLAGPDEGEHTWLAEGAPAVPAAEHAAVGRAVREDGQGVEGGTWLDVMHEQLAPEHISETGPQRAVVLELGPPEPAATEGEARFAAEWEQVRWRLEMDADAARVDRELAVTA